MKMQSVVLELLHMDRHGKEWHISATLLGMHLKRILCGLSKLPTLMKHIKQ
jgi:hypothetical protein